MTTLEIAANVAVAGSILLAARNNVHTWWFGIIGCSLFGWLFWEAKLYADVVLQGFFVTASVYGWYQWLYGARGAPLPVVRTRLGLLALFAITAAIVAFGYGLLLHRFTDAYAPFADSIVLAFSVLAQLLLMKRRIETWAFWLLVNAVAVPLYASRGLFLTSFLYAVYGFNAIYGAWKWRQEMVKQPSV